MKTIFTITFLLGYIIAQAQQDSLPEVSARTGKKRKIFEAVYPIGENPNIGYKTSMVSQETILFEANPFLRLSLINTMDKFMSSVPNKNWKLKNWGFAWYISYRPQLRMYTDNSMPVKTPSCKISIIGLQLAKVFERGEDRLSMLAFSFESGHFSNGQDRSAFNADIADGTEQSDSVYNLITDKTNLSKILNRNSGNFSTNYTEILASYKWFLSTDDKYRPMKTLSLQGGVTVYHDKLLFVGNIGGYSDADIKIYGRNRFTFGGSYMWRLNKTDLNRFVVSVNTEVIVKPHPSVESWRTEFTATYFMHNNMGFFLSASAGHDNYNYRFVDSGFQAFGGITFDIFPPVQLKR
jgi:hypothetical protein